MRYLQQHPAASRSEVMAASIDERQEVYAWLFKSKRKGVADNRIRIMVEGEAFKKLHAAWARVGYRSEAWCHLTRRQSAARRIGRRR